MQEIPSNIDWSATAAMIAATVAFFSLIVSPIVSYKIAIKQITSAAELTKHKEWIEELKITASKFISNIQNAVTLIRSEKPEYLKEAFRLHQEIMLLQTQLSIILDFQNQVHRDLFDELFKSTKQLNKLLDSKSQEDIDLLIGFLSKSAEITNLITKNSSIRSKI